MQSVCKWLDSVFIYVLHSGLTFLGSKFLSNFSLLCVHFFVFLSSIPFRSRFCGMLLHIDNTDNKTRDKKAGHYNAAHSLEKDLAFHHMWWKGSISNTWMENVSTSDVQLYSILAAVVSDLLPGLRHGHISTTSSGTNKHKRDRGRWKKNWGERDGGRGIRHYKREKEARKM